jgi:GNAT superfamily N-acetyltransferase
MAHRSYFLELASRSAFRPKPFSRDDIGVRRISVAGASRARALWTGVGRGFWTERAEWPLPQWDRHLENPTVHFAIAAIPDEDIGFFELQHTEGETKLEGFGLVGAWRDRGLGGGLLSAATQCAFDAGARRIWLHPATDDHPHALPNYQARGYRIYREEVLEDPMPGS